VVAPLNAAYKMFFSARKARESVESSDDSYHSLDAMEISLNNEGSVDHQVKETMVGCIERLSINV
jgi:hypothetical protein